MDPPSATSGPQHGGSRGAHRPPTAPPMPIYHCSPIALKYKGMLVGRGAKRSVEVIFPHLWRWKPAAGIETEPWHCQHRYVPTGLPGTGSFCRGCCPSARAPALLPPTAHRSSRPGTPPLLKEPAILLESHFRLTAPSEELEDPPRGEIPYSTTRVGSLSTCLESHQHRDLRHADRFSQRWPRSSAQAWLRERRWEQTTAADLPLAAKALSHLYRRTLGVH